MSLLLAYHEVFAQRPFFLMITLMFLIYQASKAIYRLYFHHLAKFPGPKLAALTSWYEFYYDGILPGQYVFEIERMHAKYGPIVRVSPEELHVNDPSFIHQLYARGSQKRDKLPPFIALCGYDPSGYVRQDKSNICQGCRMLVLSIPISKEIPC